MVKHMPQPRPFILQWHITERCNWHCKHCYQDENYIKEELSTEQLYEVLNQYLFLIRKWKIPRNLATINITGGEPFLRKDFLKFAERLSENSHLFNWSILSNGSFVTKYLAKRLKALNLSRYQVSLEGLEDSNDDIRGKGSFRKVIKAIKILAEEKIYTNVSHTLTKTNMKDVPELVELLYKAGAGSMGTRRLIPHGIGIKLKDDLLEPEELRKYYLQVAEINKRLKQKNKKFFISIGCESGIFNDAIQGGVRKNHCGIIDGRIIIVMPNGDVLPCRRLPIVIGNVLEKSLFEIYYNSNKLWELRNLNNAHPFCRECFNFSKCFGGAFCVKYCYSKKLFVPDVQCSKFYKKLEKPEFFNKFEDKASKKLKLIRS